MTSFILTTLKNTLKRSLTLFPHAKGMKSRLESWQHSNMLISFPLELGF